MFIVEHCQTCDDKKNQQENIKTSQEESCLDTSLACIFMALLILVLSILWILNKIIKILLFLSTYI
jgi:hypothetical protein